VVRALLRWMWRRRKGIIRDDSVPACQLFPENSRRERQGRHGKGREPKVF